jgi:hypothetical protein
VLNTWVGEVVLEVRNVGLFSRICNHIKTDNRPWVLAYSKNNRDTPLGGLTPSFTPPTLVGDIRGGCIIP